MNSNPYYDKKGLVSSSSLKILLKSIKKFKLFLDGELEQKDTKSMSEGTLIHLYILQKDIFDKEVIVFDYDVPNSPAKIKFCTNIFSKIKLIEAYKDAYTTKESDEKITEKAKKLKAECKSYLKYLKLSENKLVISTELYNKIQTTSEEIKSHKMASKLLYNDPKVELLENIDYYNEYDIYFKALGVDCKALLDRVVIDFDNKIIKLADLKTTYDISKFKETFENFRYDLQLAFYSLALSKLDSEVLKGNNIEDFKLEVYIVAVDTNTFEVKVIDFKESELIDSAKEISNLLKRAKYHIDNNKWKHSMEYYEGDGTEKL